MRYKYRKPFKVTPDVLARLRDLRAAGKSYRLCGELVGITASGAFKWLNGLRGQWSARC